ncbi:MAG TPA: MOSC domain-containing protein [Acidimicrobiales bacterium]|nr:MOSC domain-containing protein [Acidimicrobiales bacterium]
MDDRVTCDICRFDSRAYTAHDAERTLASIPIRWAWTSEGATQEALTRSPAAGAPSAADHAATALGATTVHEAVHHLQEAGRALHVAGAGTPTDRGRVVQINTSGGGVPKLPVDRVAIGLRGLMGDRQKARRHHGRVWQAVSLWSVEVIERLRSEGHPLAPGLAGENLTVAGIDWPRVRPGTRVAVGTVLLEVSSYCTPCTKNAQWFLRGDFNRMHHERESGVSRLYASVLVDGEVAVGDEVVVEP